MATCLNQWLNQWLGKTTLTWWNCVMSGKWPWVVSVSGVSMGQVWKLLATTSWQEIKRCAWQMEILFLLYTFYVHESRRQFPTSPLCHQILASPLASCLSVCHVWTADCLTVEKLGGETQVECRVRGFFYLQIFSLVDLPLSISISLPLLLPTHTHTCTC